MMSPLPRLLRVTLLATLPWVVASCGTRTGLLDPPATPPAADAATCPPNPTVCVARSDDPCGASRVVPAVCDDTLSWRCPAGSRPHERTVEAPPVCRPFLEAGGPVAALGGSLARVPTDDGRCLWIGEDVTLRSGAQLRNVAFEVDPGAPPGTCPTRAVFAGGEPRSIVAVEGADPSLVVQITGAYRLGGRTRVTYRLFRVDGGPHFGLSQVGSGLGRWDAASQRVVIPGPDALRFGTELDLGDASWASGDRAYVWGCPEPIEFLTERCYVARLDGADRAELLVRGGLWAANGRRSEAVTVFDAGPWVSSVVAVGGTARLAHVFAVGFGGDLQVHSAAAPEGPWTSATSVARCDLPAGDPMAFCAGPVVHEELVDPTRPRELPVTYGVGSTAPGGPRDPLAHWPRLHWVRVP